MRHKKLEKLVRHYGKSVDDILKRDNFHYVLCGQDAKETKLVIDHIIPVTKNGTNNTANLRTTFMACNHGKKIYEHEK